MHFHQSQDLVSPPTTRTDPSGPPLAEAPTSAAQPSQRNGALDARTEVPTRNGTTTVQHLEVGEVVFGSRGQHVTVTGNSEHAPGRASFEVEFASGERIVTDETQSWLVEHRGPQRSLKLPSWRSTSQLAGTVAAFGPATLAIQVAPAVRMNTRDLPMDPYALGIWMYADLDSKPSRHSISEVLAHRSHEQARSPLRSRQRAGHWAETVRSESHRRDLIARLDQTHMTGGRYIPMSYLRAARWQRRMLLAGILDGGGLVSDGGEVLVYAASQTLATGVHELIATLGYRPWTRPTGNGGFVVGFVTADQVFGLDDLNWLHNSLRRKSASARPRRLIVAVRPVEPRPLRSLRIASDDGVLLVTSSFIPVAATAGRALPRRLRSSNPEHQDQPFGEVSDSATLPPSRRKT